MSGKSVKDVEGIHEPIVSLISRFHYLVTYEWQFDPEGEDERPLSESESDPGSDYSPGKEDDDDEEGENGSKAVSYNLKPTGVSVGFVVKERLTCRQEKLMIILYAIESDRDPSDLRPLQLSPSLEAHSQSKLNWRKHFVRRVQTDLAEFAKNVDLSPLLAVVHATIQLESLLSSLTPEHLSSILLQPTEDSILSLLASSKEHHWDELVRMFLFGSFTRKRTRRDPDQTMPIRSRFRSTEMLRSILLQDDNHLTLTSGRGLGALLSIVLTGQSTTTRVFATKLGFPSSPEHIVDTITRHCEESPDLPFENMNLYGTANSLFSFVVGTRTRIKLNKHNHRVLARFTYYFSTSLQQEWISVLGEMAGANIFCSNEDRRKVSYNDMLLFWRRLFVVYGIWGLGSGLLPLQITNSLVEIGLVSPPSLEIMSDFVAQTPKLGASRALAKLGFPIGEKDPSSASLAFRASFRAVREYLSSLGICSKHFRYDPMDHEHVLCKMTRTMKLLKEGRREQESLKMWLTDWNPDVELGVDARLVREENERIACELSIVLSRSF